MKISKFIFSTNIALSLSLSSLSAAIIPVTNNNDSGAGSFRAALLAAAPGDTIQFAAGVGGQTISLLSDLPGINQNLTINGPATPATINGSLSFSGLYIQSGTVVINNLNASECFIFGGSGGTSGGGGGLGAGGGVFVNQGVTLTLQNVDLLNNFAAGGDGGAGIPLSPVSGPGGGGGGFNSGDGADAVFGPGPGVTGGGGDLGGQSGSSGGDGGFGGLGGVAGPNAGGSFGGGGGGGGSGINGVNGSPALPTAGGNGGSGGGTGGGGGGGSGTVDGGIGGAGAFGGGGGGGASSTNTGGAGGAGGFGAGGGGGGFGVAPGAGGAVIFAGGAGGGGGGTGAGGGGGGGALGGGIFIRNGGTLNIIDGVVSGSSLLAGMGGTGIGTGASGGNGSAFGTDIFLMSGGILNYTVSNGTITVPTAIQSDLGAGGGVGGGLQKFGAGTLIITGISTYTGGTTVTGGTLQGDTNSLQGNITDNANLTFDQAFNGTYTGVISGSGSVTKSNTGTVIFNGANTYLGTTFVNAGILQAGAVNTFSSSSTFNVTSTLNLNNFSQVIGALEGSGLVTLGTATLTTGGNGASTTFSGTISGTGALVKTGAGTFIVTGANSYAGGTTVSAGTLQGTTTSLQGNIVDNSVLVFDQNFNGTYAGNLSGSGVLFKNGTGTVILTGTSTYSGGTTVNGGTLQGNTTSLQGNILDNANVTFDQAIAGTYAGVISGSGTVTKQNVGTVTFTGPNSYLGTTFVNGGTLQAGAINTFSPNSTFLVTSTLNLNNFSQVIGALEGIGSVTLGTATLTTGGNGASTTFSGIISGTGALVKAGGGTFIITGANAYSGGTTVNAGTLQGTTTSLQGNIAINSTLAFNQDFNGAFTGNLSGAGSLLKQGTGTVILPNVYTFNGATSVQAGSLEVDGTLPSAVTVLQGGTLLGTGTIASLNNSGHVAPGLGLGTLNVTGNFTQSSTGILDIEIASNGATDLLNITGTATLAGSVQVQALPGQYQSGQSFTFLTAGGGESGTLDLLPIPIISGQRLFAFLRFFPNSVVLELGVFQSLCSQVPNGNPGSVACYIDQLPFAPGDDLNDDVLQLHSLSGENLIHALYSLQPSFFGSFAYVEQENASQIAHILDRRMDLLHGNLCLHRPGRRVSVWGDGYGQLFKQHHFNDRTHFSADTEGGMGGVDVRAYENLYAGLYGFYDTSHVDWNLGVGGGHAHGYGGGAYGTYFWNRFFADATFLAKKSTIDIHRHIKYGTINRVAKSEHHGNTLAGSLAFGWNAVEKDFLVQPFAEFDYVYAKEDKIREKDALDLNLLVQKRSTAMLRSELGLNFAYCYARKNFNLVPQLHMSYVRESRFKNGKLTAQFANFANLPLDFVVVTGNPSRNLFSRGLELTAGFLNNRINLSGSYTMESDFHKNSIQDFDLMLNFSF